MIIRDAVVEDASVLAAISGASMTSVWHEGDFISAMESDLALCIVAALEDEIAGYVVMYHAADEGEIPSVAVRADHRRLGIGSALLAELFSRAAGLHISRIFLEVRKSNEPAIALYEKHGFLCAGSRPRFYSDPVEDALIYTTVVV